MKFQSPPPSPLQKNHLSVLYTGIIAFFLPKQGMPGLLVISCDKDFQLCTEFIKKGFGKDDIWILGSPRRREMNLVGGFGLR